MGVFYSRDFKCRKWENSITFFSTKLHKLNIWNCLNGNIQVQVSLFLLGIFVKIIFRIYAKMRFYAIWHYKLERKNKSYNHLSVEVKKMSNKEFIYSTHLWGSLVGPSHQTHQNTNQIKVPNRVPESKRKTSDHLWDHENPEFKERKMSLD